MNVRLAVRHDEDFVAGQMSMKNRFQARRTPRDLAFVPHPAIRFQFAHEFIEIMGHRMQLGRMDFPSEPREAAPVEQCPTPAIQPLQLICATRTVTSEISAASPVKR